MRVNVANNCYRDAVFFKSILCQSVSELLKGGHRAVTKLGTMNPKETTYLLGKSRREAVRINIPDTKDANQVLNRQDYAYYEARPLWIKIRLCLFWMFWAAFVAVVVLFVLMYWCIVPSLCTKDVEYSV